MSAAATASAPGEPLVRLRDVRKVYPGRGRRSAPVTAVDGVDLDIPAGSIQAVVGYSGAGKSTLVRLVNALEPATSGSIVVDGTEVVGLPERRLRELRLRIGMVFQQFHLFEARTVWGNLAYPLQVAGVDRAEQQRRISELLHFVGLPDKAHVHPRHLSGGQKQRVGIARALATRPALLLADEATSALDPETTGEVLDLLRRVNSELGTTVVLITHEMDVVRTLADRVAVMEAGRVVEQGSVYDVFADPQQPVTRRFVGTVVDGVPAPGVLAALRERYAGSFVTLTFRDRTARQGDVFAALHGHGVSFELVHGGVQDVQGRTFGDLTLAVDGTEAGVAAALDDVRRLVPVKELA